MALRKLSDKLHSSCGETLVETLAAILVAALAVALLFSCVTVSTNMNRNARAAAEKNDLGFSAAEAQASPLPDSARVSVGTTEVSVRLYGGNGLYSYKEVTTP